MKTHVVRSIGYILITLPKSLESIGTTAFLNCSSLPAINIPDGVKSIGAAAFDSCSSLTSVTIPRNVSSVGDQAFHNSGIKEAMFSEDKTVLYAVPIDTTNYVIPNTVTRINDGAFADCHKLVSVTIPNSVTYLGKDAFWDCALESVVIPDSITAIGDNAFVVNTHLKSVVLPSQLKSIGRGAFQVCKALTSISLPDSLETVGMAAFQATGITTPLLSADRTVLYYVPATFPSYTIPSTVTKINNGAFYGCTKLTSVSIPACVESIGEKAFFQCGNLTSISLPDSVKYVGDGAFAESNIKSPILLPNQTELCYVPKAYEEYFIPDTVRKINGNAFSRCTRLKSIIIPKSVTFIGDYAFFDCTHLTDITIPDSVIVLGVGAFNACASLSAVKLSENLTSLSSGVFTDCSSLTQVAIPHRITSIGAFEFENCNKLKSVIIPGKVNSIGDYLFGTQYGDSSFDEVNATIYGVANSYAQNYAELNNLPFVSTAITDTGTPNNASVTVNGTLVTFEAYTINDCNYFKLRDLAMALSGTSKQFDVSWDGENNAISLTSGKAYTPIGKELTLSGKSNAVTVEMAGSKVLLAGKHIYLTAYQVNGSNYFKLRDLASALNFDVTWNSSKKMIIIDTSAAYTN